MILPPPRSTLFPYTTLFRNMYCYMWNSLVCFRLPVKACRPQSKLIPRSFYLRFKDCCESRTEQGKFNLFTKDQLLLNISSVFGTTSRNFSKNIFIFRRQNLAFKFGREIWPGV